MKVLLLMNEITESAYADFYAGLHKQIGSVDYRRLSTADQENLKSYFKAHVDLSKFDRIIVDLRFLSVIPQSRFFKQLKNVVFMDNMEALECGDSGACYEKHIAFYKKIPWCRVIVSSYYLMNKLQTENIDAWCVPEGFSAPKNDEAKPRNIDLMLLDNQFSKKFPKRQQFIDSCVEKYPNLVIEKELITDPNHFKGVKKVIFTNINTQEYNAMVFSAMANGSLVLCYDQGREENQGIGFKHLENIVLFKDTEVFHKNLATLIKREDIANKIAEQGQKLALSKHQQVDLGRIVGQHIAQSMRNIDDYRLGISAFGLKFK